MGIPSFYRQVCRRFPRIISKTVGRSEWLCLDFNCAMYYVLRAQPPFRSEEAATWERSFCTAIVGYMEEIVRIGRPLKGLYISCDGVVCAAKRRQQRLRRFKGPWFSAATAHMEGRVPIEGWDQNALTPGSAFMALLGSCLEAAGASLATRSGLQVVVSTTSEPGEGEHKLLAAMRRIRPSSCMIYGLDADLILLSMLLHQETGAAVSLLREAQEFERDLAAAAAEWRTLDVPGLIAALGLPIHQIPSFVAAMSLLGNDFLPRPITKTVRDDGIPQILQFLESSPDSLISEEGGLHSATLRRLIDEWAAREEADILAAVRKAVKDRDRYYPTELDRWTASPARRGGLTALLDEGTGRLRADWPSIYRSWTHGLEPIAARYCAGLAWIWDYYTGRPVDQGWCFEPHLPPLWSDIAAALTVPLALRPPPILYPTPLPEWLHLLAVLPSDSVERLLPVEKANLIREAPWYWPTRWALFDIGRSQLWECEPDLPIPSDAVLRALAKT